MDALFQPRYMHERLFARVERTCYCTDIASRYKSGRIVKQEYWDTTMTSFVRVMTFDQETILTDMIASKQHGVSVARWNGGKYKRLLLKPS